MSFQKEQATYFLLGSGQDHKMLTNSSSGQFKAALVLLAQKHAALNCR